MITKFPVCLLLLVVQAKQTYYCNIIQWIELRMSIITWINVNFDIKSHDQ